MKLDDDSIRRDIEGTTLSNQEGSALIAAKDLLDHINRAKGDEAELTDALTKAIYVFGELRPIVTAKGTTLPEAVIGATEWLETLIKSLEEG
jgi:hypothetical protein